MISIQVPSNSIDYVYKRACATDEVHKGVRVVDGVLGSAEGVTSLEVEEVGVMEFLDEQGVQLRVFIGGG